MAKNEKREAARLFYVNGWSGKAIAATLGISEGTVSSWKNEDKWDELIAKNAALEVDNVQHIQFIMSHQLRQLRRFIEDADAANKTYTVDKGAIDGLVKLNACLRKPDLTWEQSVRLLKRFLDYTSQSNGDLARQIQPVMGEFLQDLKTASSEM